MEIERKWLVNGFPDNEPWPCIRKAIVRQGYISTAPAVRIRETVDERGACYMLCFKGKGTLAREEVELPLTKEQFEQLCVFTGSNLITKNYRVYQLPNERRLEVSCVDEGSATSFWYAEVEFDSVEQANAFVPPAYLGEDKTEDPAFSMSAYWRKTRGAK